MAKRVLIAGESWTTHSIHQKGFDSFTTTEYNEGVRWLRAALEDNGWTVDGTGDYSIEHNELCLNSSHQFILRKGPAYGSLELAANIRGLDENESQGKFGLVLFNQNDEVFRLSVDAERSVILANGESRNLPQDIHLSQHHQLRIVKMHHGTVCYFDDVLVAEVTGQLPETSAGVFATGVRVAIDMIRLTSI